MCGVAALLWVELRGTTPRRGRPNRNGRATEAFAIPAIAPKCPDVSPVATIAAPLEALWSPRLARSPARQIRIRPRQIRRCPGPRAGPTRQILRISP